MSTRLNWDKLKKQKYLKKVKEVNAPSITRTSRIHFCRFCKSKIHYVHFQNQFLAFNEDGNPHRHAVNYVPTKAAASHGSGHTPL